VAKPEPFDWSAVVVGHWKVVDRRPGLGKGGRVCYRAVSRCGVLTVFNGQALAAGATKTCEACRPLLMQVHTRAGPTPPPARVVPESRMSLHRTLWEEYNQVDVETKNIRGPEAKKDWDNHGAPCLRDLLTRTGLGLDYGWKVYVRDIHEFGQVQRPPAPGRVRVKSDAPATRRIDATIRPPGGRYYFDVDICTGRSGEWVEVVSRVRGAADVMADVGLVGRNGPPDGGQPAGRGKAVQPAPKAQPAAPAPALPPVPETAAAVLAAGVARMEKLRGGLDAVIHVAREAQAGAALKAEIEARAAALREKAAPLAAAADKAVEEERVAREAAAVAEAALAAAAKVLAAAQQERDWAAKNAEDAVLAKGRAIEAAAPVLAEWQAAQAELAEAERMEAERLKSLGSAPDLAGLLAALEKMGAPA